MPTPGDFIIQFVDLYYVYSLEYYDDQAHYASATVTVAPGGTVTGIDAQLVITTISGRVTTAGEPLTNVSVSAYGDESGGSAMTNANGEYTIDGLGPGDHVIQFVDLDYVYSPEYYDDQAHDADANLVSVTVGENLTGIDAVGHHHDLRPRHQRRRRTPHERQRRRLRRRWQWRVHRRQRRVHHRHAHLRRLRHPVRRPRLRLQHRVLRQPDRLRLANLVSVTAGQNLSGIDAVLCPHGCADRHRRRR